MHSGVLYYSTRVLMASRVCHNSTSIKRVLKRQHACVLVFQNAFRRFSARAQNAFWHFSARAKNAFLWQAIPARKRHHLDAYHLHYAVKYAVKCRKTAYFTPSCAKNGRFLRPQMSLSRARVKSAVLNIKTRVKYGAFVHITTP